MIAPAYVLDTHALVWFVKGQFRSIGQSALLTMLGARARIVIPSYALEEVQRKFRPGKAPDKNMAIPPTALLRLVSKCRNVRVLERGGAVLARELELRHGKRTNGIDDEDISIAASALVVRQYYGGPCCLLTRDSVLTPWAAKVGITVLWI